MKSTSLLSLTALGFALVGAASSRADTIDAGAYTIDYSSHGAAGVGLPDGWSNNLVGLYPQQHVTGDNSPYLTVSGDLHATFQAQAGKIFDKVYFVGTTGAVYFNEDGGVYSRIGWTVNGGTFSGGPTSGGVENYPGRSDFGEEWHMTGPSTGQSYYHRGDIWYSTTWSDGVAGSGYYSIGASTFSVDMTGSITISDGGYSQWPSSITPQGLVLFMSFADEPTAGVPDGASTAGLLLLALAGMVSVRRVTKREGENPKTFGRIFHK